MAKLEAASPSKCSLRTPTHTHQPIRQSTHPSPTSICSKRRKSLQNKEHLLGNNTITIIAYINKNIPDNHNKLETERKQPSSSPLSPRTPPISRKKNWKALWVSEIRPIALVGPAPPPPQCCSYCTMRAA